MAIVVTLTEQKMKDGSTKLKLASPYSPTLPAKCRALGGKWNSETKHWYFDQRDANRVRTMCVEAFGIDPLAEPDEQPELVTVRLNMDAFNTSAAELWLFGRELVSQPSRDSATRLGRDVILVSGGFKGGGSRANPSMNAQDGTIIEVRDVPRPLADEQIAKWATLATQRAELLAQKEEQAHGTDLGGLLRTFRREAEAAKSAIWIVEDAPQPDRVKTGTEQIGALFMALTTGDRRAVIISMIANMPVSERPALLKEIGVFAEQGGI